MKFPKIIGFYTESDNNNYYVKHAKKLEQQCIDYKFDYYFEKKISLKNYNKNCKIKPKFILDCLNKFNEPLLFLDIDADITGEIPEELNVLHNYDIGIAKTWNDPLSDEKEEYQKFITSKSMHGKYLMVRDGFLFVNNTANSKLFISDWENKCRTINNTDHIILDYCVKEHLKLNKTKIKILSGFVNCCPTIDKIPCEILKKDKNKLLTEKRVFCFYGVSGCP